MVDTTKIDWSTVDVDKCIELMADARKNVEAMLETYDKLAVMFRVVKMFPEIAEHNKKFRIGEDNQWSHWIEIDGECRKLSRKKYMHLKKGTPL